MKRKISILLPDLRGGGAERVSIDLAYELDRIGYDVEFLLMQASGDLLNEAKNRFSVVDLAAPRMRLVLGALVRHLRNRRPTALLAMMWPLTVIAPIAQRLSRHHCKVLVSEHGILSAQYRDWGSAHRLLLRGSASLGYRLADHRIGVSAGVSNDMATLSGMRRDLFEVIYNPVSPRSKPAKAVLERVNELWTVPSGARILTVGTMKTVKNHPLLLRAFSKLDRPDARLMFVGDGSGREVLLPLAQELGVAERVILAGFHQDPTPYYNTADLFVLSSDYEGFGNVIVEAMACGTPIVSTDCPSGPGEILQGGQYGRLVPVGDEFALAEAIEASLRSVHDREALIRRAGDFSPQIAARKYLNLLGLT